MELSEVKEFLKIEPEWTEEDTTLLTWVRAFKHTLRIETGKIYNPNNSLHKDVMQLYINHRNNNRDTYSLDKHKEFVTFSAAQLLLDIRYGDDLDDSEYTGP